MLKNRWSNAFFVLALCLATATGLAGSVADGQAAYLRQDFATALDILLPLAEQGDAQAQVAIGILYARGHGVPQDGERAVEWYTKAAQQGIPQVQHDLAVKYFHGLGIPRDYALAADWWGKAADKGMAESAYNLGLMHARGLGVARDDAAAVRWYRQAAEQGHPRARYSLAASLAGGQGVGQDYTRAAHWFGLAAGQGVAEAQYNLAVLLENGRGVPVDLDQATEWYRRAADQGIAPARERLTKLQAAPIAEAAHLPASWVDRHDPEHYTVQLVSVSSEQAVTRFLKTLDDMDQDRGFIRYEANGATRYAALFGVFVDREEAAVALEHLPDTLRNSLQPFVRQIGDLQRLIAR